MWRLLYPIYGLSWTARNKFCAQFLFNTSFFCVLFSLSFAGICNWICSIFSLLSSLFHSCVPCVLFPTKNLNQKVLSNCVCVQCVRDVRMFSCNSPVVMGTRTVDYVSQFPKSFCHSVCVDSDRILNICIIVRMPISLSLSLSCWCKFQGCTTQLFQRCSHFVELAKMLPQFSLKWIGSNFTGMYNVVSLCVCQYCTVHTLYTTMVCWTCAVHVAWIQNKCRLKTKPRYAVQYNAW